MPRDRYGGENGMVGYNPSSYEESGGYAGEVGRGAFGGAVSGASAGTSIMPGWGTLIGGVLGLGGGLLSGHFGAKERRRRETDKAAAWYKAKNDLAKLRYQSRVAATQNVQNSLSPANAMLGNMYGSYNAHDLSQTPWDEPRMPSPAEAAEPVKKKPAARAKEKPSYDSERETPRKGKNGAKPQRK